MPDGPRAHGPAWLGLLQRRSTFRLTGAYLQFQDQRHWHASVRALQDQGWGVGGIFLGLSRHSFVHEEDRQVVRNGAPATIRVAVMSAEQERRWRSAMVAATGTTDANETKRLASSAGLPPGSVVWFDNEDPSDVVFEQHELDYYAAFIAELAIERSGQPAYRPGLYAHQSIAAQLLARHPGLWIWEVDYGNNVDRSTMPPLRPPTPTDRRLALEPGNRDAQIKAFQVVPAGAGAGAPWGCWPVWRQWQGNNDVDLPPRADGDLTPVKKWDWNSSIVRDPGDPQPTPRLAVAAGGPAAWTARLDDVDPEISDGHQTRPRRGRLTLQLPVAGARPVEVPPEQRWELHPSSAITPVVGAGAPEMLVVFTLNELGSTVWDARRWSPVRPLWPSSLTASPRVPHAVAAAAPSPLDLHVVWAATGQQLWSARRALSGPWREPARIGGDLRLHPYARVAAAPAAGAFHVLTVDQTGRLMHLRWAPPAAWPPTAVTSLGGARTLPEGDLLLAAGDGGTLVAVAVGADLQLRRWVLLPGAGASWSPPATLGRPTDTVHPQTRLGAARPRAGGLVVSAVNGSGEVVRFSIDAGGGWATASATRVPAPPGTAAVHPLTDLPSLPDGRLVLATIAPGTPGAALVDPVSGAATALA